MSIEEEGQAIIANRLARSTNRAARRFPTGLEGEWRPVLLRVLRERIHDRAKLEGARKAVEAAFEGYVQAEQEHYRRYFEDRLREIDGQLAAQ